MENHELKERIRENIKEEISISNVKKDFDIRARQNKKIIYTLSSLCMVLVVAIGILFITHSSQNNENTLPSKFSQENLAIDLNINVIKDMSMRKLDADVQIVETDQIQKEFPFVQDLSIPEDYQLENSYILYIRKNTTASDYNILHDYVLNYTKDDVNQIRIAFSKIESPIRDYHIQDTTKTSKIGDVKLIISQWEDMYIVTFEYKDMYFDIETTGITEDQLVDLLISVINHSSNTNQTIEDQDTHVNEEPSEISETDYPFYYAGKYIDHNGNNIVLLVDDNAQNRKEICQIFNITESQTIFKKANYSYEYLANLQHQIGVKMQNNEFSFIISSSLAEDKNCIEVVVTTNIKNDWNKIKALDTIGGAIDIQYNANNSLSKFSATTE